MNMKNLKNLSKNVVSLFYIFLSVVAVGAVILLVVKPILVAPYALVIYFIFDFLATFLQKKK